MVAYKHILCNSNFNIKNSPTGDCLAVFHHFYH